MKRKNPDKTVKTVTVKSVSLRKNGSVELIKTTLKKAKIYREFAR